MTENNPLVSIVMAAYNEEKYIREAIESILNQTYPHFEFIIINDGSTDKTEEVILSFQDARIRYVRNEQNLRLIASLNKGLALAEGKYIARMDSDDISLPDRLQIQVDFMEAHPEIGISGAQLIVFGSENTTMNYPLAHEDLQLRLLITSCFPNNLVIFRNKLVKQYHLAFTEGYHHGEDFKFWTQWLQLTEGANLPDYLVKYRFHASSVSHKFRDIQRQTRKRVRTEYVKELFRLQGAESRLAEDLYGEDYGLKIKAVKSLLEINKSRKYFAQDKLQHTLQYLWYLDSLEQVEQSPGIYLKFTRIFSISLWQNVRYWEYILKHTVKKQLGLLSK